MIALCSGLFTSCAFPPFSFLPAALVGPGLFFRHLRKNSRFSVGFLYGGGLLAPQLHWLSSFNPLAPYGVILVSALPYGGAALAARGEHGSFRHAFLVAAAFTSAEVIRSVGTFALPWGILGSLAADLPLRMLAPWIGLFGLSLLFYLLAAMISIRPLLTSLCVAGLLLLPGQRSDRAGESVVVGLVQGNFSQDEDFEFQPASVKDHLFQATRELGRRGAKTIFWSETVILEYLNRSTPLRREISNLASNTGTTIILGAPGIVTRVDKRNSIYIFEPDPRREVARYDKFHLVPFGEFIPGLGPDLDHVLIPRGTGDFSPSILPKALGIYGPLVCYEGVFPYLSRALVNQGALCLVNLSNDAWACVPEAAEQHAALARLRAAEFARPLIRAGNVGPSYILDAAGTALAELEAGRSGVLMGEVHLNSGRTAASFLGDWIGWSCLLGLPFILTVRTLLGEV